MKRMHWKKIRLKKMWNRALSLTLAFSMTASLCFVASLLPAAGAEEEEGEPHYHTFACYEKYELDCRENHAEGEHRERCYTYSGELVCGFEEGELHVHNEQECEKVARILVCEEEEGEEIPDEEIVDEETLSGSEEAEETKSREDSVTDGSADEENSGAGSVAGGDGAGSVGGGDGAGSVAGGDGAGSGADHTENGGTGADGKETDANEAGSDGNEPAGGGTDGAETNEDGAAGNEADGSEGNGSGADGSEGNESGTDGSGAVGSEDNGSETAEGEGNGSGAAGSESNESGAAGDGGSEDAGGNYAAFAVSEAAESYGYFRKTEAGRPYLLNHTVTDEDQAEDPNQESADKVQSEAGSDENGSHSDNLLSGRENPEENNPGETGEEKKEGREEPGTEAESESEEETLESTAEDREENDVIQEPEGMEGESTETGTTEASSEAETTGVPDAEENPQESIAKEEMQESASEGESEEEETSAAETEEEQVHEHTGECYVDIYRCRKRIRLMALQGGRASNEAELLAMISGAENDQETVIQIADNFEISQTVEINSGKDIIIELDGYTLTYDGAGTSLFQVNTGGELKIADSDSEEQNPVITKDSTVREPGETTFDKTTGELTYYVTEATVNLDGRSTTNTTTRYDVDFGMDDVDISGREAGALESANPTESLITVSGGTLTIEGGRLTNSGGNHGVLVNGGTVNMTGGYILGCGKTDRDASGYNDGGGIQIKAGRLEMKGGVIANNKGFRGGGIYTGGGTVTISKGIIAENTALQGGGLYAEREGTTAEIKGGVISANRAGANGGGIFSSRAVINISGEAAVIGNTANQTGGAIRSNYGQSRLNITGGYIAGNEANGEVVSEAADAPGDGHGGGIYAHGGPVSIENAVIVANKAKEQTGNGGGIYSEGVITKIGGSTVVAGNKATSGGGVYLTGTIGADNKIAGYAAISNNQAYGNGGGIYSDSSKFELSGNAAVTGNSAGTEGGGIYNGSSAQQKIPIKNNSIIAANTAGDGKSNSIYPSDYKLPDTENKNGYMIEETSYVDGIWSTNQANAVTTVQELKDRIKDASTGHFDATVIPLGDNIEIDPASPVVISGGRNIILDLKGYNITTSSASGNYLFSAEGSDSSLTITDSASGEDPEPEIISEEAGDPQEAGRVGEYENDCLTYYITESEPDGIYTKEKTYQYRIIPKQRKENKPVGTIDGNGIFSVLSAERGACITVEGGMITNPGGKHGIAVAEQSAFMMKGGYIVECGGSSDGEKTDGGGILSVGSRIQILDGVIAGNKASGNGGGICAEDNQEVLITGGIIAANEAENQGGGLSVQSSEKSSSAATIKGDAVISGNLARIRETPKIEADRGSAYLDRLYGGGGVFSDAEAKLLIQEECYITNNRVERETPKNEKDGGGTGGGGVFSCGAVRMSGGYVTANYSQASGGGVYSYAGKSTGGSGRDSYTGNITLSGGSIAGNYACYNEGGGLRSDWSATIEKTGDSRIYLTNNVTDTRDNWGGGGIFNTSTAFMSIKNVLITENTAHGFGGGIAGCNHGTNRLFVKEGGAIFGNTARGGEDCPKLEGYETHAVAKKDDKNNADRVDARMHVYAEETDLGRFIDYADESGKGYYQDFYCANVSQVNDQMLGGGSAGWRGSSSDNDKSEKSPVAHTLVIEKGGYAESRNTMGLTAYPEQMPSDWEDVAEIYITGNRSLAHGGGVMTNGTFQVGGKETGGPAAGTLEIEKKMRDADGKKITGDKTFNFKIQLKNQDGEDLTAKYEAVRDPKDGGENPGKFWIGDGDVFSLHSDQKLTISGLPVAGYRVEEVFQEGEDHYIVEISNKEVTDNRDEGVLWADEGKKVTFVNIPKQDLTISKVVLKNGEPLAAGDLREADEFEFLLTFTDGRGNPFTGEPYTDRLSCEKHKHAGENMIPITDTSSIVQEENRLKVRLHHNECLVVHDLPVGIKYKVEEEKASYPLGYLPTSDGNGDYEYNHEQQGSGSIQAGQDTSVKFVNILSSDRGNLAISKKVQDPGGNDILPADTQMFEFTVRLMDTNGRDLPGRYELFDYSGEDSPDDYPDANRATIASGETLRLRQDEEVIIQNLPPGTQYAVTEKPVTGYQSADGEYEKRGVIESAGKIWYAEFFNIKNPQEPDIPDKPSEPDKPGEPEDPTSPTRHPSGGGGGGDGGGGGGSTNPTPPSPTDPALEPPAQAATEPELPEQPPQPEYPSQLPDPNNPDSPGTITILVNGVPTTYFKYWDPELKEYVYLLEDQIPLGYMLPDAGEDSHRLLWLTLCGISMAGMMLLAWNGKRERIRKNRKQ